MGGKFEVLQKLNSYLVQLLKLAKPTSPPHPQHSHEKLYLLSLELKRLHVALYLHDFHKNHHFVSTLSSLSIIWSSWSSSSW